MGTEDYSFSGLLHNFTRVTVGRVTGNRVKYVIGSKGHGSKRPLLKKVIGHIGHGSKGQG